MGTTLDWQRSLWVRMCRELESSTVPYSALVTSHWNQHQELNDIYSWNGFNPLIRAKCAWEEE